MTDMLNEVIDHSAVSVLLVRLVCIIMPPFRLPLSAIPLEIGRWSLLAPLLTVKFASEISSGLRVWIVGMP